MKRYKRFLEKLYAHVQNDWDRIIPVVGDERVGKSTLILESLWLWEDIRGNNPTPASVLSRVIYDDREAFKQTFLSSDYYDPIAVMDAAHVLYNGDVMMPDQKEVAKNLLDTGRFRNITFLGYQSWADVPRWLRERRAQNAISIPRRGYLKGFNRTQLDEKEANMKADEWPEPALEDTFPSLEGHELYERFCEIDAERKRKRLQSEDDGETDVTPQEVVDKILGDGRLAEFVDYNEFQDRHYYDKSFIRFEYPSLSDQQASQVRSALRREADPATLAEGNEDRDAEDGETDTQPPSTGGEA
jgi:hypothetical protein